MGSKSDKLSDNFLGFNHYKGPIYMETGPGGIQELRPVEIHLKEDGAIDDKPSFAIVMVNKLNCRYFGQLSLKMLNEGLADIGYKIEKK